MSDGGRISQIVGTWPSARQANPPTGGAIVVVVLEEVDVVELVEDAVVEGAVDWMVVDVGDETVDGGVDVDRMTVELEFAAESVSFAHPLAAQPTATANDAAANDAAAREFMVVDTSPRRPRSRRSHRSRLARAPSTSSILAVILVQQHTTTKSGRGGLLGQRWVS